MKREHLYRAKNLHTGEWIEGFLIERGKKSWIVAYSLDRDPVHINVGYWHVNTPSAPVDPKTVCEYANRQLAKGDKVFEGTIAFYEQEEDFGDIRQYVVCVYINEWGMFAWLHSDEYSTYLEKGTAGFNEYEMYDFWLGNCSDKHYAGNIFDNPELIDLYAGLKL